MAVLNCEVSLLTQDEAKRIHDASVRAIEEVGVKVEHERMLRILKEYGADVEFNTMIVKFPRALVEDSIREYVKKINGPQDDTKQDNPGQALKTKDGTMNLSTHIFCVNICDTDTENVRPATLRDLEESVIVANELENVTGIGPLVVPNDVPMELNDAYMWATVLKRSKKRVSGELLNPETLRYIYEMCVVAAGSEEKLKKDPLICFPCFPTSPLSFSRYALDMAFQTIDMGMPVRFGCPMVVAGFTAPVTLAGATTVANAESLAGIVMGEAVGGNNFGSFGFSISVNHANGTALYGSPEKQLMNFAMRDMAKFYGIKAWKHYGGHTGCSDACHPGMQAGIEKAFSLMFHKMTADGYAHGYCGMVSPEVASIPQMAVDDEICALMNRMGRGMEVNEEKISFDLIRQLGIHGNYIDLNNDEALDHMVKYYREEYWLPKLFVRERPQRWQETREDMLHLAKEKVQRIVAENDPHPLGKEKEKEIDAILKRCLASHK